MNYVILISFAICKNKLFPITILEIGKNVNLKYFSFSNSKGLLFIN